MRGPAGAAIRAALLVVGVAACGTPRADPEIRAPAGSGCALDGSRREWVETILGGWERVTVRFLDLDAPAVPWMVLYDSTCVWHVSPERSRLVEIGIEAGAGGSLGFMGRAVPVVSRPHGDRVLLPDRSSQEPRPDARASLWGEPRTPFFILALPEIWRTAPGMPESFDAEGFFAGVAIHELVHTLQLAAVDRRLKALEEEHELPEGLNDDVIQDRFQGDSAYVRAYRAELDLFRRAAQADDPGRRDELIRRGLSEARSRKARWMSGGDRVLSELEDLFLNMEGVAVWAHYRLHGAWPDRIAFEAGGDGYWSQDEGFVLVRLLERTAPGWRGAVLGAEMASPFDLLEAAVGR